MTLEDIIETIKLLTVKVEMNNNINKENGTGILVIQNNKAYVLTVYHCIYGKKKPYHTVDIDNVTFKFNSKVTTEDIKPLNIEGYKENIVLLEVDITKLKIDGIKELLLLDRVFHDKSYHLRGYPKVLSSDHRFETKCNDKDLDEITFKITVDELNNTTLADDANEFIAGVSGSGVFFSEHNHLYLVGLVNALADKDGTFNAVHCVKLIDLHYSNISLSEFYEINDIAKRLRNIEDNISEETCLKFELDNTKYYSNLNRKHIAIWNKKEVFDKNFKAIKNYLQGKNSINEIKLIDSSFEENILEFSKEVLNNIENYISKYVNSKKEGRDNLKTVRENTLLAVTKDLTVINSDSYISNKLQEYIVVGWLLNCNIDFIIEEED